MEGCRGDPLVSFVGDSRSWNVLGVVHGGPKLKGVQRMFLHLLLPREPEISCLPYVSDRVPVGRRKGFFFSEFHSCSVRSFGDGLWCSVSG